MQVGHQGQKQGAGGQFGQVGAAFRVHGCLEQSSAGGCYLGAELFLRSHSLVPLVNETLYLSRAERGQRVGLEIFQPAQGVLVSVGAAGDEKPALLGCAGKVLDGLAHPIAETVGLGHLVQAIEEQQAAFFQQGSAQGRKKVGPAMLSQFELNELPQHPGVAFSGGGRDGLGSELAKDDAYWQQPAQRPVLQSPQPRLIGFQFGHGQA